MGAAFSGSGSPTPTRGRGWSTSPAPTAGASWSPPTFRRATRFYETVFGWGTEGHGEGPGAYYEWKINGRSVRRDDAQAAEHAGRGAAALGRCTSPWPDTDGAVARAVELGGSVVMPPMEIEPGRFAVLADPTGAVFNVIRMSEAPSS